MAREVIPTTDKLEMKAYWENEWITYSFKIEEKNLTFKLKIPYDENPDITIRQPIMKALLNCLKSYQHQEILEFLCAHSKYRE